MHPSDRYVFFLDAAPTERLLSQEGSLLTFLQEEKDMGAASGGKLRNSILKGASSTCMAGVRAMALICDSVLWKMIRAVKPSAEKHVLDVLPRVWPAAHSFFERAALSPSAIVDDSLQMELGVADEPAATTAGRAKRSARNAIDMARIRLAAAGDPMVERLLTAAFEAMAKATANHAAEWLPAGLVATDGSTTTEGKLCSAQLTPELYARYDALTSTSTPVERLHAIGRVTDDRGKRQRVESRAGPALGIFNGQGADLAGLPIEELERRFNCCRPVARKVRKQTVKQQLIAAGRAKQEEREVKLSSKRARRAAKALETARVEKVTLVTRYSELKSMAIGGLSDQLRAFRLQGTTAITFTLTQANRAAYCTQLQVLLFEAHGEGANDLQGDDSGCDGDGVVRKVRAREGGSGGGGKKCKGWSCLNGYWWKDNEEFDMERCLDKKVERRTVGKVTRPSFSNHSPPTLSNTSNSQITITALTSCACPHLIGRGRRQPRSSYTTKCYGRGFHQSSPRGSRQIRSTTTLSTTMRQLWRLRQSWRLRKRLGWMEMTLMMKNSCVCRGCHTLFDRFHT
jgi:hypothetical protein